MLNILSCDIFQLYISFIKMVAQTLYPLKKIRVSFCCILCTSVLLYSLLGKGLADALAHSVGCLPVFLSISFINKALNFDVWLIWLLWLLCQYWHMFKQLLNKCPYGQVTDHSELKCPDCVISKGNHIENRWAQTSWTVPKFLGLLLVSIICYDERGMLVNALDSADHNKSRSKRVGGLFWK